MSQGFHEFPFRRQVKILTGFALIGLFLRWTGLLYDYRFWMFAAILLYFEVYLRTKAVREAPPSSAPPSPPQCQCRSPHPPATPDAPPRLPWYPLA